MIKKALANNKLVIYQAKSGAIELRGDISRDTVWATQAQIVKLFNVDQSVASRHINNLFKDKEIDQKSNMQKMHIANSDIRLDKRICRHNRYPIAVIYSNRERYIV